MGKKKKAYQHFNTQKNATSFYSQSLDNNWNQKFFTWWTWTTPHAADFFIIASTLNLI